MIESLETEKIRILDELDQYRSKYKAMLTTLGKMFLKNCFILIVAITFRF